MTEHDKTDDTLIEFPCDFPIKVMATAEPSVKREIDKIMAAHPGPTGRVSVRDSRTGKYIAYTVVMPFTSKAQLDNTYRQLHAIEGVRMVL